MRIKKIERLIVKYHEQIGRGRFRSLPTTNSVPLNTIKHGFPTVSVYPHWNFR